MNPAGTLAVDTTAPNAPTITSIPENAGGGINAVEAADGTTVVRGAAELRVKESDRLAVMAAGLRTLGIAVDETPDGASIHGGALRGGEVDSHGDHRIAMSFAIAGLIAQAPVRIADCANVATSFPGFDALANGCGFDLRVATG